MTGDPVRIRLEPLAVELDVARGGSLAAGLAEHGVEFPCGGMGECGGCRVRVLSGSLPITEADRRTFTTEELAGGWRLACQACAGAPLVLECAQWHMEVLTDNSEVFHIPPASGAATGSTQSQPETRQKIAIDLGTTTIAAQIIHLASGDVLGVETMLNPQAAFGSDVMSRIHAALEGLDLTTLTRDALGELVARLTAKHQSQVAEVLLVGNTVMHHLFCGLSVEPLSHVPFESPNLGEQRFTPRELSWNLPADCVIRFARCVGGFVGSDILAGIVATGIANGPELRALVDLGTNGEIAIGNQDGIVCASTAAGPAFEAGSIRMGMRAVTGAISHVALAGDVPRCTVIGDIAPRGICGSGVIDAVAAGLRSNAILSSGRITDGTKQYPVAPPVVLFQSDIRELQLAKGAIAAGFRLLLKRFATNGEKRPGLEDTGLVGAGLEGTGFSPYIDRPGKNRGALAPEGPSPLHSIHLAGAFGNYVQIDSAIRIGLLEFPHNLIHAAGNTALRGAKMLLLASQEPAFPPIVHISLAADHDFQDEFAACMTFPEK